ncbi:MAG: DUF5717 family protein [Muricoprocola sp.]
MKKRLHELLNGKIEYNLPQLKILPEKIEGVVPKGKNLKGKFEIATEDGKSVQGFIYSSSSRMRLSVSSFFCNRETILYEVDVAGLKSGESIQGELILCTSYGQYELPYQVMIRERNSFCEKEPSGEMTLEEFLETAREDFTKAYVRFASKEFPSVVKQWGIQEELTYRSISCGGMSYQSMEQFLIGIGAKEPQEFTLSSEHVYLHDVEATSKEEIMVLRQGWGFVSFHVESDAPFLVIERSSFTTEEFIGSSYHLTFFIKKEELHAGRNFGCIRICYDGMELCCQVEVHNEAAVLTEKSLHRQKQEIIRMMSSFIGYQTGRIEAADFAGMSLQSLENYRKTGSAHIFFDLYEIYVLLMGKDEIQASLLLEQIRERTAQLTDPVSYGFYLYLTLLRNEDRETREKAKEKIEKLYLENQENWMMEWLMLRVNPEAFRNDTERLDRIRHQFYCGCNSPFMYLEAYQLLKKEPLLLRKLEKFEIHLLKFICRENLMDREISGQIAQLAGRLQSFDEIMFQIMQSCFEQFPTRNMLTSICSMLIKGRKRDPEYARWYAMGIKQDVRITGMYEYFVETSEDITDRMLPQSVRLYFRYNNTLDYTKKALIYANIVRNRHRDPDTFEAYRSMIRRFLQEQILEEHVTDQLAFLYQVLLTEEDLDEMLLEGFCKILFTEEILVDNPNVKYVIITHGQLEKEQRVMVRDGHAFVLIYNEQCKILTEDETGRRLGDPALYTRKTLMNKEAYLKCLRKAQNPPMGILLYDCANVRDESIVTEENASEFLTLLGKSGLKKEYQDLIRTRLLEYFVGNWKREGKEKFLDLCNLEEMFTENRKALAVLLAETGRYEDIFRLVTKYGLEEIDLEILVRMCHFYLEKDSDTLDVMLLPVCTYCFRNELFDEAILKYLMRHFEGPVQMMKKIWYKGKEFGLDSLEFEERLLVLLFMTQEDLEDTEPVFESYVRKFGKDKICRAYAILMAYEYFVREMPVQEYVFYYLEQTALGNVSLPDVCKLALMRYYTELTDRTAGQESLLYYFLQKYLGQGMYFAFYEKLPEKMKEHFHIQDLHILEYRGNPEAEVVLHYAINGEKEKSILMAPGFEGIRAKEFVLFYGDVIEWYYTIEEKGRKEDTGILSYKMAKKSADHAISQYDIINRLLQARERTDETRWESALEDYVGLKYLVNEMFGLKE